MAGSRDPTERRALVIARRSKQKEVEAMVEVRTAPIASHVPGRLRLRHDALRRGAVNAEVVTAIALLDGAISVAGNPRTAGVLVLYDAAILPPSAAESLVLGCLAAVADVERDEAPAAEPEISQEKPAKAERPSPRTRFAATYRKVRVPVNIAMLATLGGSLLALGIGRKAHAALGVAHLGVLALHLVQYRRRLVS